MKARPIDSGLHSHIVVKLLTAKTQTKVFGSETARRTQETLLSRDWFGVDFGDAIDPERYASPSPR